MLQFLIITKYDYYASMTFVVFFAILGKKTKSRRGRDEKGGRYDLTCRGLALYFQTVHQDRIRSRCLGLGHGCGFFIRVAIGHRYTRAQDPP